MVSRRVPRFRGPSHGVSGYATTGKPGDFQFQYHNHGQVGQQDVAASRYGLQSHGSFQQTQPGLFNPYFTQPGSINITEPVPNSSAAWEEPLIAYKEENTYRVASKILSHQYQRLGKASHGTFLKNRIYEGFGQYDPAIQYMIRDMHVSEDIPVHQAPWQLRHRRVSLTPPIRQNDMQKATANPVQLIQGLVGPDMSQQGAPALSQLRTMPMSNSGQLGTGTHHQSGDALGSGHPIHESPGSASNDLVFAGSIHTPMVAPYLAEAIPPQADIRPTGSTGQLRDVTPEMSVVLPKSNRPVQTQL